MRMPSFSAPSVGAVLLLVAWGCDTETPSAPEAALDASPLFSFNGIPPGEHSPHDDLARNPSRSGYPHPLESTRGWGGGWDKWDIVDAVRREPAWYNGLAFCGGNRGYCGQPCGWRQATINFGEMRTFNQVAVWHHGVDHVPNVYNIQYWDGASWVTVFATTVGRTYLAHPPGPPWYWYNSFSTPTLNTFSAVTGSKVRFELNNCGTTHGWIYEFEVYLSNQPPIADAGPDQTAECTGSSGATVTLDGSGSTDPDNDQLEYEWSEDGVPIASGSTPEVTLALGTHTLLLTVEDGNGGTSTDEVVVAVRDTQAPVVELTVGRESLWPPNHTMVMVAHDVSASDVCCAATLMVEVASNEPVNGLGDGDAEPDWEVVDNSDGTFDVLVRAERSGTGNGRVYTISATATDCAGNSATAVGTVTVPHQKGKE